MIPDLQLKTLIGLVLTVLAAVLLIQNKSVQATDFYNAFSYVVTAVSIALVLWNRYLWRFWPFQPYLHSKPDLGGTWKGQLVTDYPMKAGSPIEVYLVIRQTYSSIDIRLFSLESSSVSLSGNFFADNVGLYTLASTYRNTPTVLRRQKSPISHGGLLLSIRGTPIHQLDGEYWTDRNTKGEVVFNARSREVAHDYGHAETLKYVQLAFRKH
jgi:hypothetical protein